MRETDVLIVGAGVHGVGVAQAAAAAGHAVLLLERREVAAGTSSRSSKLIHGGLRYLESFQWKLVRESLRERQLLLQIAPDLVRLVPFHIPVYRDTSRRPWQIRAGLSLYALLGSLRSDARFTQVPKSEWDGLDGLKRDGLQAVYRYYDGQTDDALLCRAVLRSAQELGAEYEEGAELLSAVHGDKGWEVSYQQGGEVREARCRILVNAAGPWANRVLDRFKPTPPRREVDLVGGTHIELTGALEQGIYYTEAPSDRRAVFTMPWKGHVLVGTTERKYTGDPSELEPTDGEIEYLEGVLRHYFPERADAERTAEWAGLRVLPRGEGKAFDRPREVILVPDEEARPTVLTIYGGKLTGYRLTARKVMDVLARNLPPRPRKADTGESCSAGEPPPGGASR